MSAQRSVPPARSSRALIAALVAGAALGAGATLLVGGAAPRSVALRRTTAQVASPDRSRIAWSVESRCADREGWCTALYVGSSIAAGAQVAEYQDPLATCDEIVWTPDGTRVGFVIRGHQLRLFEPQSGKELGTVRLVTDEAAQTRRARGVTFSENGRAVTFDDCPRTQSGCRAAVAGVPQ
jgi:hypothetical protein